jgi:hypothetical protein
MNLPRNLPIGCTLLVCLLQTHSQAAHRTSRVSANSPHNTWTIKRDTEEEIAGDLLAKARILLEGENPTK